MSSSEIQALREELDTANKKVDRYVHLVATLSEELDNLRRSICHNCKKKLVPSYSPVVASSPDKPRHSIWRRLVSPQTPSPSSIHPPLLPNAGGSFSTSTPVQPIVPRNQANTTILAPLQAFSSTAQRQPSVAVDAVRLEEPRWMVAHNPEIKQALHIDHVKTFDVEIAVCCIKFSPDSKFLAVGLTMKIGRTYIYDVEKGSKYCFLEDLYLGRDMPAIWCVQFSPDSKYIATASSDGRIRLWEIARRRVRASFKYVYHRVGACSVSFSPDCRFLVSSDALGLVRIWSLRDGSSKELGRILCNIFSVVFSPNGRHVASLDINGWLRIWDARTGQLLDKWKGHPNEGFCIAFSPDGKGLVSGGKDVIVRYWDVESLAGMESRRERVIAGTPGQRFRQIRTFDGHTAYIRSIAYSPDGRWVLSGSQDQSVRLWDALTGTLQCTLLGHSAHIRGVDFSPSGNYLASGSGDRQRDHQVVLWRVTPVGQ